MLYSIYTGYVQGYQGGQRSVVHLVVSVADVVSEGLDYVFTDGHGEVKLSQFYKDLKDLDKIDWGIMRATFWNDTVEDGDRKRRRQAEFLIHDHCPWSLIKGIGVMDAKVESAVHELIREVGHRPKVKVMPAWYY